MNEVTNYLEDLNKSITNLEQKSIVNNRLSEEKMLTRHLVSEIRTLMQIVKHQQQGGERPS
jgi:primosomal protein N''